MTGDRDIHLVAGETRDNYRWVVLGVTSLGALLAASTSGTLVGTNGLDMAPFISVLHIAFGVGVVASLAGAVVSASRGGQREYDDAAADRRVAA